MVKFLEFLPERTRKILLSYWFVEDLKNGKITLKDFLNDLRLFKSQLIEREKIDAKDIEDLEKLIAKEIKKYGKLNFIRKFFWHRWNIIQRLSKKPDAIQRPNFIRKRKYEGVKLFDNYDKWASIRNQYLPELRENLGNVTRKKLALFFLELSQHLAKSRLSLKTWNKTNIESFINYCIVKNIISPKFKNFHIKSITEGRFQRGPNYLSSGSMNKQITGCLVQYGVKIDDSILTNEIFVIRQRWHFIDQINYEKRLKEILIGNYGIEMQPIFAPLEVLAFLLCGYPVVGINSTGRDPHTFAIVGHEIELVFQENIFTIPILRAFRNGFDWTKFERLKPAPGGYLEGDLNYYVLNPVTLKH